MAKRDFQKKPLYRKVNTRTHHVFHDIGPDYRHQRNTKAETRNEAMNAGMAKGKRRGLDYTPLYRFLLSKVGRPWAEVHSEAVARLDREEPIWNIVARTPGDARRYHRTSESSVFSGLEVDADGVLRRVDPDLRNEDLWPTCRCCTHTFNGELLVNAYDETAHRTTYADATAKPDTDRRTP